MEFTEFVNILKPIIGGADTTHSFVRTLFDVVATEEGRPLLNDVKESTYKNYFNGLIKITKMAQRISPYLEPEEFVAYLNVFSDATAQQIVDAFTPFIGGLNPSNMSEKVAYFFCDIIRTAATAEKKKSTPKSAKKDGVKTPHDILEEKVLASGQAVADAWGEAVSRLVTPSTTTDAKNTSCKLDEKKLNQKDLAFLERFRNQVEPLFIYCMEHDPTAVGTKISLADEINDFLLSWKYDVRKIQDSCFRTIVIDSMQVLDDYTYYLSDKFLRWIPDTDILWFRNESPEEGDQLRDVLRPETFKKRTEMRDIYVRLYPIPKDDEENKTDDVNAIQLPEEDTNGEYPYLSEDTILLKEFTADYDEIMVTMIGENYSSSLIDMTLPSKIQDLYTTKWKSKADSFLDLSLKSNVFGLLGELNKLSESFLSASFDTSFIKDTRVKIRNLYVKLHPDLFSGAFPYDAFIDDWNDGEF